MANDSDNDWSSVAEMLVGVIDLRLGTAVRAVAGERSAYQPVPHGDAFALIDHYRSVGVRQFYVADLDALTGGIRQWNRLNQIVGHLDVAESIWIDAGWRGREPREQWQALEQMMLGELRPGRVHWIVATETVSEPKSLDRLVEHLTPARLTLGLDYRSGQFVGNASADDWIEHADDIGFEQSLVLDVSAVGTMSGPATLPLVKRLVERFPDWTWLSGGGIRNVDDVDQLLDAGCEGCLVASAIQ